MSRKSKRIPSAGLEAMRILRFSGRLLRCGKKWRK